jgi:hypothetical protein
MALRHAVAVARASATIAETEAMARHARSKFVRDSETGARLIREQAQTILARPHAVAELASSMQEAERLKRLDLAESLQQARNLSAAERE